MAMFRGGVSLSAIIFATVSTSCASAQTTPSTERAVTLDPPQEETADIIVTGSLIAGSAENSALPVEVIGQAEMERRGAPTVLEMVRSVPAIGSILGESNATSAAAAGTQGSSSVNMRGLGANRTLVLLNGRRLAGSANGTVDVNLIPLAALGRLEILKDGAAATYGSDAIAGVVNFITQNKFTGIELKADQSWIQGSDGDTNLGANAGIASGRLNVFLSAGYQRRSGISMRDRDFALNPYLTNPQGGFSSSGSPGTFQRINSAGQVISGPVADPNCAALGNVSLAPSSCLYTYTPFQNVVDAQTRYQLFGNAEYKFSDNVRAHIEGLYAHTRVVTPISPSTIPSAFPTGAVLSPGVTSIANRYIVPCANPGLQDILARNPAFATAVGGAGCVNSAQAAAGSFTSIAAWRPYGVGGNPFSGYAKDTTREIEAYRLSGGFSGTIAGSIDWDVAVTHNVTESQIVGSDVVINRMQLALAGLGGPNCTGTTPGANGCQWFNPFSNAIQSNVTTGATNPQYNPGVVNSLALSEWLEEPYGSYQRNSLTAYDAVVSGRLGFLNMPGGQIGWAVGAQYRELTLKTDYFDYNNLAVFPCIDSPNNPAATCTTARGPLSSTSASMPVDLNQNVKAIFAELQLPVTDALNAQLAVRHEAYGGGIGSTTNPKLAVKWELVRGFSLRGSVSTTFRAPTASDVDPSATTTLSPLTAAGGTSKQIDFFGDPTLRPETATSINVGAIVERGPFVAKIDYWRFEFKDPIVRPPFNAIASNVVAMPNGLATCAAPLRDRVTFDNGNTCIQGVTSGLNIIRVRADLENGPQTKVDGIDFDTSLKFNVGTGNLLLNASGSYMLHYDVGATIIQGVTVANGYSAAGFLNEDRGGALPRFKGYGRIDYSIGIHSVGFGLRYTSRYKDERTTIFTTASPLGQTIAQRGLVDFSYVVRPGPLTLSVTVNNVFDTDPPFARTVYSYDTFTGDPLGRVIKAGLRAQF